MEAIAINEADLRYCYRLDLAGVRCDVVTNSSALGSTLDGWHPDAIEENPEAFIMRVVVNADAADRSKAPHFRGRHHVVIASFGVANIFVFDLLRRSVTATISTETSRNKQFWNELLLPMAVGIFGATVGVVPVHCACLSDREDGFLLAGHSGAGKSTLSVALAQAGFDYVSDDWTFLSEQQKKLTAYGISPIVKLLPDAIHHFPALAKQRVRTSLNGELAYELAVADAFGASITRRCRPRWFFILERQSQPGSEFVPMSSRQAGEYVESSVERLPKQLASAESVRARIIRRISLLACWKFLYAGSPQFAAREIRAFLCDQKRQAIT